MDNKLPKDQHAWNALIFILFPVLVVVTYRLFESQGYLQTLFSLSVFDLLLISLATFRLIRLVCFDKIFSFARVVFYDTLPDGTMIKPPKGFRRAVAELMECPWCVGIWASCVITVFYVVTPLGRFFAILLMTAALGTFFQVISRRVGAGTSYHSDSPHTCS